MTSFSYSTAEDKRPVDYARVLRQIEGLRELTIQRGCTFAESENAALKIGLAVQRYGLVVRPPGYMPIVSEREVSFLDVEAIAETAKALLVAIADREVWIPFSQLSDESEVSAKGNYGTLVVRRWFAERAGLCPGRRSC